MRFCHVTTYPPDLLQSHDEATRELAGAPYAIQNQRLMSVLYSWSDFLARYVAGQGGTGRVIVANHRREQLQWAREHSLRRTTRDAILLEQLRHEQPHAVFFQNSYTFSAAFVREVRSVLPKGALIMSWCGLASIPPRIPPIIGELDLFVVAGWPIAEQFPVRARATVVMSHGFEASVLDRVPADGDRILASFVGQVGTSLHGERRALLEAVANVVPLSVYSGTLRSRPKTALRELAAAIVRRKLRAHLALMASPLRRGARPAAYGADMYAVLRRSDISLNQQGGNVSFYVPNQRLFEITGCGSCIVTDARPGIEKLFEPDTEIVTYRSAADLAEKVAWLRDHPRERAAIAAAGQRRTLKDHTLRNRVDELLCEIQSRL